MKRQIVLVMGIVLLAGVVLSACAPPAPEATPTSAPTSTPLPGPTEVTTPPDKETASFGGPEVALAHTKKPEEEILATVNDETIRWSDYEPELVRTIYLVSQQYAVDWNDETNRALLPMLQEEVLRQVAARVLMRQLAKEEGITFTPEEAQAAFDEQRTTILGFGQYATWEKFLQENGLSEAYFERLVEDTLLIERLSAKHGPGREAEQAHVRHILVETEAEALEITEKLKAGADFGKLAAELSTDTGSKDQGGDLGWFPRGVMVPEFEDAAFSLPVGEVSAPIQSEFGYHVLEVLERGPRELDDEAYEQALQQAFMDWFAEAQKEAEIVYQVHFVPQAEATPEAAPTATP
ncbi:MAG: peptidylprolyl isomerase [Anaerolineae bacterium]